jgi:hypothetical protein
MVIDHMFMKNNSPRFYIILLKKILTWYHFFISFIDWILNLENLYSKSKIKILQDIYIYIYIYIIFYMLSWSLLL